MQAAHIRGKGAFNQNFDPVCGDLAKAGRFFVPQIGADRDLGSGAGSMVETDQVKNGQSAASLDVIQGPIGERYGYLVRMTDVIADRRAVAEPLDVKPRRHDDPEPNRFPIPAPL